MKGGRVLSSRMPDNLISKDLVLPNLGTQVHPKTNIAMNDKGL